MSFLFNYSNQFSLVDNNSKYGVFCQLYTHSGMSRPIQIQAQNNQDYHATMDKAGQIHVLSMPSRYQISYFNYDAGHYSKKTIVENATETYTFSNPIIHTLEEALHIFYLSNKVGSNTYAIVHQVLNDSSVETLLETTYSLHELKSYVFDDSIYIFYVIQNNDYLLKCLKITKDSKKDLTLFASKLPICDYCVCLSENLIEVTYVAALHGKYQLIYYNSRANSLKILCNTLTPSNPSIFWYYGYLWISYLEDNKLRTILSIDEGNSFSAPILCTIQNTTRRFICMVLKNCSLRCTELYASISNVVHLNTLFFIDFEQIHPDSKVSLELELLIEGLTLSKKACSHITELMAENTALKEEVKLLKAKYEPHFLNTTVSPKDSEGVPTSIKSAANAFMDELPNWDAPPRL